MLKIIQAWQAKDTETLMSEAKSINAKAAASAIEVTNKARAVGAAELYNSFGGNNNPYAAIAAANAMNKGVVSAFGGNQFPPASRL